MEEIKSENKPVDVLAESPLDEARRLKDDTARMLNDIKTERARMEEIAAINALQGKAMAGQAVKTKTQDEIDTEQAQKIRSVLGRK